MMEYDKLIEQILSDPLLQSVVNTEEETKGKFLNLVSADWKNRLNEYDVLNRYNMPDEDLFEYVHNSTCGQTQLIHHEKDKLFLMLAFPCYFPTGSMNSFFSIYACKTEPLSIIAKTLTSDINYKCRIAREFKFFMELCNWKKCNACGNCRHQFESAGYKIDDINPCIHNTYVYDKKICPRFGSSIKQLFGTKNFVSICLIEIDRRIKYYHKNDCNKPILRIGARIHKMIAIDQSIMRNKDEVPFVGHLEPFLDSDGKSVGGKKRRQDTDSLNQSTSRKKTKKEEKEEQERILKSCTGNNWDDFVLSE